MGKGHGKPMGFPRIWMVLEWIFQRFSLLFVQEKAELSSSPVGVDPPRWPPHLARPWDEKTGDGRPRVGRQDLEDFGGENPLWMIIFSSYVSHYQRVHLKSSKYSIWLVVWNMILFYVIIGNGIVIPIDELIFLRGVGIPPISWGFWMVTFFKRER